MISYSEFQQEDTIRGTVEGFTNKCGLITLDILLINKKQLTITTKVDEAAELEHYVKIGDGSVIDFKGTATYRTGSKFEMDLIGFELNRFEVIPFQPLSEWVDIFVQHGPSGWLEHKDPYAILRSERDSD